MEWWPVLCGRKEKEKKVRKKGKEKSTRDVTSNLVLVGVTDRY